jgi:hypothetical protein
MGASSEELESFSGDAGRESLRAFLEARFQQMPAPVQEWFNVRTGALARRLTCTFEPDAGGRSGLARLVLAIALSGGGTVAITRHFRPDRGVRAPADDY